MKHANSNPYNVDYAWGIQKNQKKKPVCFSYSAGTQRIVWKELDKSIFIGQTCHAGA